MLWRLVTTPTFTRNIHGGHQIWDQTTALHNVAWAYEAQGRFNSWMGLTPSPGPGPDPGPDPDPGHPGGSHNPQNQIVASPSHQALVESGFSSATATLMQPGQSPAVFNARALLEHLMDEDMAQLATLLEQAEQDAPGLITQVLAYLNAMTLDPQQTQARDDLVEHIDHFGTLADTSLWLSHRNDPSSPGQARAPWTTCVGAIGVAMLGVVLIGGGIGSIVGSGGVGVIWSGQVIQAGAALVVGGLVTYGAAGCGNGSWW